MVRGGTKALVAAVSLTAALGLAACGAEPTEVADTSPASDAPATVPADATSAPAPEVTTPAESEPGTAGTAADPATETSPGGTDEVVQPFMASVELLGEIPGYTPSTDQPFEGFYPLLNGDNGCVMEYRPVVLGIPASDMRLTNDDVSQAAVADLLSVTDASVEPTMTAIQLPIDGNPLFTYPFWYGVVDNTLVASSFTPVQAEDTSWESWGLDLVMSCPAGVDVSAEFLSVMTQVQPYVYVDPTFNS